MKAAALGALDVRPNLRGSLRLAFLRPHENLLTDTYVASLPRASPSFPSSPPFSLDSPPPSLFFLLFNIRLADVDSRQIEHFGNRLKNKFSFKLILLILSRQSSSGNPMLVSTQYKRYYR